MSKPKAAPAGTRTRSGKHAKVVENEDYVDLMRSAPPMNRKQRRDRARGNQMLSITCPVCHMTSHNPNDIAEGYCGHCHRWTSDPASEAGHEAKMRKIDMDWGNY